MEWLLEDEGEIVATAAIVFMMFPPSYTNRTGMKGYITNMYTHPHYRKRGIATAMLKSWMRRPRAEVFVYEADASGEKQGFIGLVGDYIAGLFVREGAQSKGIGKQLLEHVKETKQKLSLHVYQKNTGALRFYQRERFFVQSEGQDENTGEIEFLMEWSR